MTRLSPLIKGVASFVVPQLRTTHKHKPLSTISAEYCYSVFLRNYSLLRSVGATRLPKIVAELGPGSSLGTGFAALIAGADKYYALDLVDYFDEDANIKIFDELSSLFRTKTSIPASGTYSLVFPDLDSYAFPASLSFEPDSAFEKRVSAIRQDIINRTGIFFEFAAPWTQASLIRSHSIDWLFSHSVLEHIDDLDQTYQAIASWLKPGAYASHLIDFYSHGLTHEWNGHWAISDGLWFALRGKRPYLLNRESCSKHLDLAAENGLNLLLEKRNKRFDGLIREQFEPRFRAISDEDARTRMVSVIQQVAG